MMDNILMNVTDVKCYANDVFIYSGTEEIHIKHLENVFPLLLKHGIRIRIMRCSFIQPHVELLVYCINEEDIHTDKRKLPTISDAQLRISRKQLSFFLGIASCYSRFIKYFAKISRPLSEKTSERFKFWWSLPM